MLRERGDNSCYWKGLRKENEYEIDAEIGKDCGEIKDGNDNQRLEGANASYTVGCW